MDGYELRPFEAHRREELNALLAQAQLPFEDIRDEDLPAFILALDREQALVGSAGLERYGEDALLRSVAVAPHLRSAGIGTALVAAIERNAAAQQVRRLYLLTDTAESYFVRQGYSPCERAHIPDSIRGSTEFTTTCSAASTVMCKTLNAA